MTRSAVGLLVPLVFTLLVHPALAPGGDGASARVEFSQQVSEGNYTVTVTLGSRTEASDVTIKAEQRRLYYERLRLTPGEPRTCTFTVNVRTPHIPGDGDVRLKTREKEDEVAQWDDQLSVEFLGTDIVVHDLKVAPAPADTPTLFLLGDSTVCDQAREPWASWGQMLPRFLKPSIAVANYAQSGESLRSSRSSKRLAKVLSILKAGDLVMIQFGHNDMKEKGEGIGPFTSYKRDLKHYADAARAKGATVILVTSMERRSGIEKDTLGDYPAAVRELAAEQQLPLIDLHAMSKRLYKSMGDDLAKAFQDGTHHTNYGAYELAKCVTQGLKSTPVAVHIADDFQPFDPTRPDAASSVQIPPSTNSTAKPEGD